jgi:hypothetical protein
MLSTFLGQLQSYFSKYFLLGSFFPMLAFAFLNGAAVYFLIEPSRKLIDDTISNSTVGRGAFITTSVIVAIVLAAYVLSSVSTFLRRQLEGKWGKGFSKLLIPSQNRRRQNLINEVQSAAMEMADLEDASAWEGLMRTARDSGRLHWPKTRFDRPDPDELQRNLDDLELKRGKYEVVEAAELEAHVLTIARRLEACNVDLSPRLAQQHERLTALIDYARENARARHAHFQNDLNSNFGPHDPAPTRMGNIANTIQGYALRRYHCNLELIWSNLQRMVQKDEKAQAALQEAKTQLDFLVACCWLTLLSSAFWLIFFGLLMPSRTGFVATAFVGPTIAYMWYRAAAEQYRSFADVAMTSFDSFRFDLLREMRLRIPADVEEERLIWESVDRLTTYGEERNFRYEPPPRPT